MGNKILDIIAKIYRFVWYKVFQRREPWTPQFCRFEQAYPYVFWSIGVAICALIGANMDSFWSGFWGCTVLIFLVWFFPHILEYRIDHPDNTPNLVKWANKRLEVER